MICNKLRQSQRALGKKEPISFCNLSAKVMSSSQIIILIYKNRPSYIFYPGCKKFGSDVVFPVPCFAVAGNKQFNKFAGKSNVLRGA